VEFGEGLLNKGRAKKREKRPLTQIEIMAAVEREKQEKKAARRAAKVRASLLIGNDDACRVSTKRRKRRARFPEIFTPRLLGLFPVSHARERVVGHRFEDEKESHCFFRAAALTDSSAKPSLARRLSHAQEAKAEARKERIDFELNGPNKQMTKKERKRLESEGFN